MKIYITKDESEGLLEILRNRMLSIGLSSSGQVENITEKDVLEVIETGLDYLEIKKGEI